MQRAYHCPAKPIQVVLSADLLSCLMFLGRCLSTELGPMVVAEQTDDEPPFSTYRFSALSLVFANSSHKGLPGWEKSGM